VGSLKTDSFHIDGSAPFYAQLARLIGMQECHLRVSAPAIKLTAVELLVKSGIPRSALGWTLSCHRGPFACGDCPGCEKHMTVLLEAGML